MYEPLWFGPLKLFPFLLSESISVAKKKNEVDRILKRIRLDPAACLHR